MKQVKTLDLYTDDFKSQKIWEEVCEVLGVVPEKTDKVSVEFTTVQINRIKE